MKGDLFALPRGCLCAQVMARVNMLQISVTNWDLESDASPFLPIDVKLKNYRERERERDVRSRPFMLCVWFALKELNE